MAFPAPPSVYGLPDDAHVASAGDAQRIYRVLRGAEPGRNDLRSDQAVGRPGAPSEPWIEHAGLSVFDDVAVAVAIASRYPVYVAGIDLPRGLGCSIAKTGPPRHFTVWADPNVLAASVHAVYRLRYLGSELELIT
jgi:hypothetical protein